MSPQKIDLSTNKSIGWILFSKKITYHINALKKTLTVLEPYELHDLEQYLTLYQQQNPIH